MYETYSRQALPDKHYRELLGSAICVFNANNQFIIENLVRISPKDYSWSGLIDLESGQLKQPVKDVISKEYGNEIEKMFSELIQKRNRIIHSFQITRDNKQILATRELQRNGGNQFDITKEYLLDFIKQNEQLSLLLHKLRGY